MKDSPIFSKTYDLVAWIIPVTIKFPRQQRFVLASAVQQEAVCFQSLLIEAAHQYPARETLVRADAELDKLRTHLRLCLDLNLIDPGQYEHVARMLVEIGKLLGGWLRSATTKNPHSSKPREASPVIETGRLAWTAATAETSHEGG